MPPRTVTATASRREITLMRTATEADERHDDPADAVRHAEDELGAVQPGDEPDGQQRDVDGRVQERGGLQPVVGDDPAHVRRGPGPSGAAASSASAGHSPTSAGHQAKSSCSSSGRTSAPAREPGEPDDHDHPVGKTDQRLDGQPLGRHRPLLHELALERLGGALAEVDRAAGAERPAPGPLRQPRRAAPGEPAPVVRARDAERGDRCRPRRPGRAAAPSAGAAGRARACRPPRRSRRGARRGRRGSASRGAGAPRWRGPPPPPPPARARTARRTSAPRRPPAPRVRGRGRRARGRLACPRRIRASHPV